MNKLKRVLAGLLAVSCIAATVSCSSKEGGGKGSAAVSTADQVMEKSYQPVALDVDVPFRYVESMALLGDSGNIFLSGTTEDGDSVMYITDMEFSTFEKIDYDVVNNEQINSNVITSVSPDGSIMIIKSITDYGDAEMPDYDDPDFDYESFDFDALEENATFVMYITVIDQQGNIISENEIKGLDKYSDDSWGGPKGMVYLNSFFAVSGEKALISLNGSNGMTYLSLGTDGTASEPIDLGEDSYFWLSGLDKDGNFVYVSYEDSGSVIKTVDVSTMKVSDDTISLDGYDNNFNSIMKGKGEYKMYLSGTTSLYGVKDDNSIEEIVNWVDSDMTGDYIQSIIPTADEEFIVYERNWSDGSSAFYRLTKRDLSELKNTKVISMVVSYSDNEVMDLVKEFNKNHTDYRIKIEDYNKYYEWDEDKQQQTNSPEMQLKQDIASGKSFDIICMDGSSALFSNLANKGALVDFYDFLGKDGSLSKDDIIEPILSAGEVNGKLVALSPSCYINTVAAKTKYCDKENWTVDDIIDTYENKMPEGMKLYSYGNTKMDIFGNFIYGCTDYIDYANGTCDFNNPDFIRILEFCDQFYNEGEGDEIDWETASDDEINDYFNDREVACRNDKALLKEIYFDDLRGYARAKYGEFGEDITLVGIPSSNGHGARLNTATSYAIMANSPNKDACWEFISSFFTEDYQESDHVYAIPALKSSFEKKLDATMEDPYYTDENGKKHEYKDTVYMNNDSIEVPPLNKEERDYLEKYVLNATGTGFYYDPMIFSIINEEVTSYFAGEKSADKTAEIIQNRISILVSEQS